MNVQALRFESILNIEIRIEFGFTVHFNKFPLLYSSF
jgi:hypothetical protein